MIMNTEFNIYCDESCHLENDKQKSMTLGGIWIPIGKRLEITKRLREIKEQHGLSKHYEMKWTKVSPSKELFYKNIIDYFFDDEDIHFRCVVIPEKKMLNHEKYKQTHDDWYYKMYFHMLKVILRPNEKYNIYLDIKDTLGKEKIVQLHKVLSHSLYDFNQNIIKKVQLIRSHESDILQIVDLLIGAIGYFHRGLKTSSTKQALIERIMQRSGYSLVKNTLFKEDKLNILIWDTSRKDDEPT